jgi:hypothetical protein
VSYERRFQGTVHRSATDRATQFLTGFSLHLNSGERASTEATLMVHRHWFREHPTFVRSTLGFVVIAALMSLIFGPTGILYAVWLEFSTC